MIIASIVIVLLSGLIGWISARYDILDKAVLPLAIGLCYIFIYPMRLDSLAGQWREFLFQVPHFNWVMLLAVSLYAFARLISGLHDTLAGRSLNEIFGVFTYSFRHILSARKGAGDGLLSLKTAVTVEACAYIYVQRPHMGPMVFRKLVSYLKLSEPERLEAEALFQEQQRTSKPLSLIFRPFIVLNGKGHSEAQTLLLDILKIGTLSGVLDAEAISRTEYVWSLLGMDPITAQRIFARAGVTGRTRFGGRQEQYHKQNQWSNASASSSYNGLGEEATHLQTLGLSVGASLKEIKKAYRRLAKTHHPDRAIASGKSEAQIKNAVNQMQQVNDAYAWLEANA